ncbi:unnamed protein product, partial [Staurois parvus]
NIIQCKNKPNQPPTDNSTYKQASSGRPVNINWAGRYGGSKRRMVGVTGQVQQVASSIVQRVRQRDGRVTSQGSEQVASSVDQSRRSQQRNRKGCRTDTGPRTNTTPRQSLQVWP